MIRKHFQFGLATLALLGAGAALAAQHEIKATERFPATAATSIDIENLAGVVVIEGSTGREIVVESTIVAGARSDEEARRLAGLINLDAKRTGDRITLITRYPLDEYREYKYDRDGFMGWGSSTTTKYQGERVRISSHGVDLHVDYKVSVPKGVALRFKNVVGTIDASKVDGELDLDTASGPITGIGNRGRFHADTGSGSVKVIDHVGEVSADTGSGRITIERLKGDLHADTGSGGVDVRDSEGRTFDLDTGSGRIVVENATVEKFKADTGSGGIALRDAKGVRELSADAGSGSVRLDGDFSLLRDLDIDTGSGGATLTTSKPLNLRIEIDVGSGGIDVDLPNLSNVRSSRGDFTGTAGKGEGTARISTGSGGARIRQQ